MQFDRDFISRLGTKSLSRDPELTKVRVNTAWNSATKAQQAEVLRLADVKYAIAYRVRALGTITTKMTIAYSQALDIDPYYLIGASSNDGGYTYAAAKKLLLSIKCDKQVKEFEKKHLSFTPEAPVEKPKAEEPAPVIEPAPKETTGYSTAQAMTKLREEDLHDLFKALIIKAGVGKPEALASLAKLTEILMS